MPKFRFTARTLKGKIESDFIEAPSLETAISVLQNQKLIVTDIKPLEEAELAFFDQLNEIISSYFSQIKIEETVLFTKQLALLVQTKVPLVRSLRVLSQQTKNPYFSKVITSVANDVDAGMTFSKALAKHPRAFSNFYVQMLRSGEISGRLEEILSYLSDYINHQYRLTSKARGAMIYPIFIFSAFVFVATLMLIFVIPNLTFVLKESGQELPFLTRVLIGAADFVKNWSWIILVVLVSAFYFIRNSIKNSPEWRYLFDDFKLRLPIFGELLKKIYLARFSETLSTLSSAGIAVSQSLEITADIVGNAVYSHIILEANESVKRGGSISAVFDRYPEVLPIITQMIVVGEQTGKMDVILKQIAVFFSDEVSFAFDNIVSLIEPILIVVLGAGVSILVAAILLPLYNLVNAF